MGHYYNYYILQCINVNINMGSITVCYTVNILKSVRFIYRIISKVIW